MQRHLSTGSTILATLMAAQRHPLPVAEQAADESPVSAILRAALTDDRTHPDGTGPYHPDVLV